MSKYFFCTENGGTCAKHLSRFGKNAEKCAFFNIKIIRGILHERLYRFQETAMFLQTLGQSDRFLPEVSEKFQTRYQQFFIPQPLNWRAQKIEWNK